MPENFGFDFTDDFQRGKPVVQRGKKIVFSVQKIRSIFYDIPEITRFFGKPDIRVFFQRNKSGVQSGFFSGVNRPDAVPDAEPAFCSG